MKKLLIAVLAISILLPNIVYASTEMYDFKDTKTEGFIQIIKEWSSGIKLVYLIYRYLGIDLAGIEEGIL